MVRRSMSGCSLKCSILRKNNRSRSSRSKNMIQESRSSSSSSCSKCNRMIGCSSKDWIVLKSSMAVGWLRSGH